jgi:hypothetical protein
MKKLLPIFVMTLLIQNGCSSKADSPGDSVMKELISTFNELADIEEGKGPSKDLNEEKQRADEFMGRLADLRNKIDALHLSDAQKNELREKYKDAREKALQRLTQNKNFHQALENFSKQERK